MMVVWSAFAAGLLLMLGIWSARRDLAWAALVNGIFATMNLYAALRGAGMLP